MAEPRFFRIAGRVQGVGFRAATQARARALGLAGWVRNRSDGDVELVAAGPDDALEALRRWLATGPAQARVTSVAERACESTDLDEPFSTR